MALDRPFVPAQVGRAPAQTEQDPDRIYEREVEKRAVNERTQADSGRADR